MNSPPLSDCKTYGAPKSRNMNSSSWASVSSRVPKRYGLIGAVASEQNQHCGGEARAEARRAELGVEFLGRGSTVSFPSGVRGEAPATKSFGAFWILQVSSPAILLLDLGVIHSSFCSSGSARKLLRERKETFAPAVSALRGRAPPLPLRFRRLWIGVVLWWQRLHSGPLY